MRCSFARVATPEAVSRLCRYTDRTRWLRLLCSFRFVAALARQPSPCASSPSTSSRDATGTVVRSVTYIPSFPCLISHLRGLNPSSSAAAIVAAVLPTSRSWIDSL